MNKKKILIADDEPTLRLLVASTLDYGCFEIIEAVDGADALAKAKQVIPDLMILDAMMPKLSGTKVCRQARTLPALLGVKIIVLTAKGQLQDCHEAMAAGADHYVKKPFS